MEIVTCLPDALRIYTTGIPAIDRHACLMQVVSLKNGRNYDILNSEHGFKRRLSRPPR